MEVMQCPDNNKSYDPSCLQNKHHAWPNRSTALPTDVNTNKQHATQAKCPVVVMWVQSASCAPDSHVDQGHSKTTCLCQKMTKQCHKWLHTRVKRLWVMFKWLSTGRKYEKSSDMRQNRDRERSVGDLTTTGPVIRALVTGQRLDI